MELVEFTSAVASIPIGTFKVEPLENYPAVDRFYRTQGYKVKSAANESIYTIRLALENDGANNIIAAVRLVPQLSGHFWLRNLLVAKNYRGKGIASALMQQLLPLHEPLGCYCFALPHLKHFYHCLGFYMQPDHCPDDILKKYHQYRDRGRDWLLMGYIIQKSCPSEREIKMD